MWRRIAATVACVGALSAVVAWPDHQALVDGDVVLVGDAQQDGPVFAVSGRSVHGLYPGVTKNLDLTLTNPAAYRIEVRSLAGRIAATSRPGCRVSASNLVVRGYTGGLPVTVPAHGRVTLRGHLPVSMPVRASVACAAARFTIALSGATARSDG